VNSGAEGRAFYLAVRAKSFASWASKESRECIRVWGSDPGFTLAEVGGWQAESVMLDTREDRFIKQFLSAYEDGSWADADVTKPDAIDRKNAAVDQLATRKPDRRTLAGSLRARRRAPKAASGSACRRDSSIGSRVDKSEPADVAGGARRAHLRD
jgi:hypothetical protein